MELPGEPRRTIRPRATNHTSPQNLLLPKSGKFLTRFNPSDKARLQQAEVLWERNNEKLPYPKSKIPRGAETGRLIEHHYNCWREMFFLRQLLALSTLLKGIMEEPDELMGEMLLCSFSNTLEANNLFTRHATRNTPGGEPAAGVFARHDFQPKITILEQNVWGTISGRGVFLNNWEKLIGAKKYNSQPVDRIIRDEKQFHIDSLERTTTGNWNLYSTNINTIDPTKDFQLAVTDPPYVGNVNYSELGDFFYVWLRLALRNRYPNFAPEYTPKTEEIVENKTRGKSREDFFDGLKAAFAKIHRSLPDDGLLVFTFHHTDQEGLVWEGLLQSLCDAGFEVGAVYPIHGESESSLHLMDKETISYDLIHVCRKRQSIPETRSWAGIRQEVRKKSACRT